ncbi:recombinase family protein [Mesosutterella sp. AGMB02718]|uniref:Recombinase family protein n=1 Tax=Mesosutterella faecium TaxID=2925194 RepID=A0ABT7ILJ0_9BURK|nr:recombinase family protein [Mesosutterella sp. AGMB02718]MDL2059225.1 recombinase family protein [Mesosutterella sp. AGMB02718]
MKLSVWARQRGICYQTAWRLWKNGKLPVPACQLPSGTIVVDDVPAAGGVGLYARVSTVAEKDRLERQMRRLEVYAASMGWSVIDKASEIASVTNDRRRGLLKLLKNKQVRTIIVETPDRVLPSGFCYLDAALQAEGRRVIALEDAFSSEDEKKLLQELIELYSARVLGRSGAAQRARDILSMLEKEPQER